MYSYLLSGKSGNLLLQTKNLYPTVEIRYCFYIFFVLSLCWLHFQGVIMCQMILPAFGILLPLKITSSLAKQWRWILPSVVNFSNTFSVSILQYILSINIANISFIERERTIETRTDSKGIRLDVYVEDKDSRRFFDLEMQISDSDNLAKRMRYYQGLIDMDSLKRGQHYSSLSRSYIIFICPFDKFKLGRHIYTFRNSCIEDSSVQFDDEAIKIFLSTKGTINDVRPELKAFLGYVDNGTIAGDFVSEIDNAVKIVKSNDDWRLEFMTYQMALLESHMHGEEIGRREGENKLGKLIAILLQQGKNSEVQEVATNEIRRRELYKQYNIE